MPRSRGERSPVFVTIGAAKYGFLASANSAPYRAALGQTVYTNQAGVFFGANSPKPNRASKLFPAGTIASFCDPGSEADLRADDWTVTRSGNRRGIRTAGLTRTVFVEMPGGYNYAWNITAGEMTHAAVLGFSQASGSTANLIWGSTPKPPRASKRISGGTVSTFIEPRPAVINAAVTAGWSVSGVDYDLLPDA